MVVDGWVDWAVKHPGESGRYYQEPNAQLGIVLHSAEGGLPGTLGELVRAGRQASWMFTVDKDGTVYQHYEVFRSCWASGNKWANTRYWSIELIGKAGEPVNARQVESILDLFHEFEVSTGRKVARLGRWDDTVREHNEVATLVTPNAGPTACPSGRYEPLYKRMREPKEVSSEEITKLKLQMDRLNTVMTKREFLRMVASSDPAVVEQAYDKIKGVQS